MTRPDLSNEAIRLGRLLVALLPDPEAIGLLALMLLQDSRRAARTDAAGEPILFADQDRSRWDRALIGEGLALVGRAFAAGEVGSFAIQAAIAAEHARTLSETDTDWARIVSLYDMLLGADGSPVVELNRAAAVALRDGPQAGLALIDAILERGELGDYQPAHAARAELFRRLGRLDEAAAAYDRAIALTRQEPARKFLARRRRELGA